MKYLYFGIALILLSSCSTVLDDYPEYINQKEDFEEITVITDFQHYEDELGSIHRTSIENNKYLIEIISREIYTRLKKKGYDFDEFNVNSRESLPGWLQYHVLEIEPEIISSKKVKSTGRVGKRKKPEQKIFNNIDINYDFDIHEFFMSPVEKDTSINGEYKKISPAFVFLIKGVDVSVEKQATQALASAALSIVVSGGMLMIYDISWVQLQFLIIDRENKEILWHDVLKLKKENHFTQEITYCLMKLLKRLPDKNKI